ncbi:MAG: DUF362 domain-containing protein [Ignavibacteriaceae bacterium]|nr:DUF362 domain-containing protein [Ignavibacteriaceae bacterium]MCW8961944.1 DUF362 domain-containing protein [Ignavibacteriaceae bacterium]MCW9094520.1 DUF362 domain-containing protein [Ignavibacteriaceae bacterium]MCW9095852.1 DUF362 domain-containing protein [Ignavibacteriaceae bacterium]
MRSSFLLRYFKLLRYLLFSLTILLGISILVAYVPQVLNTKINPFDPLPTWEVQNPISTVFVLDSIPPTAGSLAAGDSTVPNEWLVDPAIDTLLLMMQSKDIYFYKTVSHPSGIVGSNDIVLLKGNFQWTNRNTTSTDRIKGVIWQILNHPEGFNGEIIICDNTQNFGTGINHDDNNSEDPEQSIIDVVNTFVAKGYPVSYRDWKNVWDVVAQEYSAGDYNDGFVYESDSKISYPKFTSPSGNYYISLKYGIWDSTSSDYDLDRLCIIDFPVLKAHSMAGSTIAVKNWIGVLTTAYPNERYGGFNSMHNNYFFGQYALVAKVMGVTFPKLTIVDAAWTSASGPNNLSDTVNTNVLLGSIDPCAVSWYSAKYILTPIAIDPSNTDPDLLGSNYKNNLEGWTNCLRDSGFACTKDSAEMSVYNRDVLSVTSLSIKDKNLFPLDIRLQQNYPNPFNSTTVIKYQVLEAGFVTLKVYDVLGSEVATLVKEEQPNGIYEVRFAADDLPSGDYFYKLQIGDFTETKKMILMK